MGPLVVRRGDAVIDPGPPKQRAVLAALLLARGAVVSTGRLEQSVWGDDPPAAVATSLQAYISNLRRLLRADDGSSPIERVSPGYRLQIGSDFLDVVELGQCVARAREAVDARDWDAALAESACALDLWRGRLLEEFDDQEWIAAEAAAPDELRMAAADAHITALLARGDVAEALGRAQALCRDDPLRDRSVWLHMVALYRDGRAGRALEVFAAHTRSLVDELGIDPGAQLRDLQAAILRQDPELSAWPLDPRWSGARTVVSPAPAGAARSDAGDRIVDAAVIDDTRIIGRENLVGMLRERAVAPGTRWTVLIGPAGIGKTRLAEEAVRLAEAAGERVVWIRCPDAEGVPAWWPLRQLCRALEVDTELLSVPDGADADAARFEVYERVQDLLESVSAHTPITVVVDDVQWADAMSTGLLRYLVPVLRESAVHIVVTLREEEGGDATRLLCETVARDGGTLASVPQLSRDAVGELVRAVSCVDPTATETDEIAARTGGNPLFVSEYARLPAEQRRDTVPAAVRSVLRRRLATLDPTVREVIGQAAVMGDDIDVELLAVLTGRRRDEVADCLDDAVDERIVVGSPDRAGLVFAHALLRDEAAATFAPLRRCRIHLRVAALYEGRTDPGATARRAAHLLDALPVAPVEEVVAACRAAADDATRRWDSESAAHWLGRALQTHESLAGPGASIDDRDALLVGMLRAQVRAGRAQVVLDTVEERIVAAVQQNSAVTVGRLAGVLLRAGGGWPWIAPDAAPGSLHAALESALSLAERDRPSLVRVLGALAIGHCYHRDAGVPAGYLDRAAAIAVDLGEPDVTADALLARLITYSGVSSHAAELIELADELIALPHVDSALDQVIAGSVVTMAAMCLGDVDETGARLRSAIAGSERMRLPVLRAQLRWMEAALAVWHGDFPTAQQHFRTALAVHRQTELYVAGSGALALMATASQRGMFDDVVDDVLGTGGGDRMAWVRGVVSAAPDGPVPRLLAAGVATVAVEHGDEDLIRAMIDAWAADDRPMLWTSLAEAVILADLVVELRLDEYAQTFVDVLAPFRGHIATVGQVGCVGPVDLALAGLYDILGQEWEVASALFRARTLVQAGGSEPGLLRCRLFAAARADASAERDRELVAIADRARELGIPAVADAALRAVPSRRQEEVKRPG
nr:BTAD domain-containing putative transcriptional regulator [Gordonia humi]